MLKTSKFTTAAVILTVLASAFFVFANLQRGGDGSSYKKYQFNFGLDLQGGIDLVLRVNFNEYLEDSMSNFATQLRKNLREEKVGYTAIQSVKNSVRIVLRDSEQSDKFENYITSLGGEYEYQETGPGSYMVSFSKSKITQLRGNVIGQSMEIIRNRVDENGNREIMLTALSGERISLQIPGEEDPESFKSILNTTAKLSFRLLDSTRPFVSSAEDIEGFETPYSSNILGGYGFDPSYAEGYYVVEDEVRVSGDGLIDARAVIYEGNPAVSFALNATGARDFSQTTSSNVKRYLAIVLDDKVLSTPIINEPIVGGSGIISGSFSIDEANKLALLLRAGALPAPIQIAEERVVGASLGRDSIESGKVAMGVAMLLVMIFMIIRYKVFGLFANLGILANLSLITAVLSILKSTLTLPGIAGIILTIGICVDANVLIFERIREGLAASKRSNKAAIVSEAFGSSISAILDSNITTVFSGFCMYFIGFGPIRGFAITLVVGVLCSMFSSVLFTKILVSSYVLSRTRKGKSLQI